MVYQYWEAHISYIFLYFLTATSLLWSSLTPSLKHIYRRSWKSSVRYTATTTPASTHACTSSLPQDTRLNPWTWWPWRNWIARWVSPQFSKPLQLARSCFFYLSLCTRNSCWFDELGIIIISVFNQFQIRSSSCCTVCSLYSYVNSHIVCVSL